jgi:hypothetical protein
MGSEISSLIFMRRCVPLRILWYIYFISLYPVVYLSAHRN